MARLLLVLMWVALVGPAATAACSDGECQLDEECSADSNCEAGLYCFSCTLALLPSECVRSTATNLFTLLNNSLPFNKYAYLTTHNSYAIVGEASHTGQPRLTFTNQEDNVTQQLNNGVRALMLDTYDFQGGVWLCHSIDGICFNFTAFEPAIDTMREIEAFLSANPSELVTLILEDYVQAPNGLTRVFNESGLLKYWFPVSNMPKNGQDWPLVSDMVANNQRLLVFTSNKSKEATEGIAYQWNYMVENQYGDDGLKDGVCSNRAESAFLNDTSKSLVLVNHFPSVPLEDRACVDNSASLIDMLNTCYGAAENRWANFVAVDFYKRSEGGGAFQATDLLNGRLLCGCGDVHACVTQGLHQVQKCMQCPHRISRKDHLIDCTGFWSRQTVNEGHGWVKYYMQLTEQAMTRNFSLDIRLSTITNTLAAYCTFPGVPPLRRTACANCKGIRTDTEDKLG